ncbi:hypothetical protein D6850_13595 [Roseovarius spongiae]|uniref:HPt domain-containing protein n=1 Tax=Roseovarius spongiae TaxID=2320272 RepID=A0A3A8B579_9RHOB|nr:Hpt domain-containing protein [Roseovarius spongiae]RKF14189.1 hypothetical protein D6850_13595 [Roseovarius spongiae]
MMQQGAEQMKQDALSVGLVRVRARFLDELHGRFDRIDELRLQFGNDRCDHAALREIGEIAHKIAGTAATLGFPKLGESATVIDDLVHENGEEAATNDPRLLGLIDSLCATMQEILSQHEANPSSALSKGRSRFR